ncbi:MAG: chloride channel protein [Microthrixaceae bacterium]|nr:chloride channel protein [Microthrixaceae bacterium]
MIRIPARSATNSAMVRLRSGLGIPVIAVGTLGGLLGAAYVGALHLLSGLIGPDHHAPLVQLCILAGVGAAVALVTTLGGETGNVELLVDNIHVLGGASDVRRLRTLIPASLLCVASGSAMGPEAPLVQTTGTLGTVVATRLRRSPTDVRILTICGMAAGFTVLFGAPLGSAFFALEILHRRGLQYYEALIPAIVGSLCGYGVYLALSDLGIDSVWHFARFGVLSSRDLSVAAIIGLIGAIGAWVFATTVGLLRRALRPVPTWGRYVLGGVTLGLLGMWSPFALTFGEVQLNEIVDGRLALGTLAVAAVAKFAGTSVVLATGWKGGFIIPLFFIGATAGQMAHHELPMLNTTVLMACAMTALCVGVTKTPVGSTLVVTEMAGLALLPVTMIAAVVALVVSSRVELIETQRARNPLPAAPPPMQG